MWCREDWANLGSILHLYQCLYLYLYQYLHLTTVLRSLVPLFPTCTRTPYADPPCNLHLYCAQHAAARRILWRIAAAYHMVSLVWALHRSCVRCTARCTAHTTYHTVHHILCTTHRILRIVYSITHILQPALCTLHLTHYSC